MKQPMRDPDRSEKVRREINNFKDINQDYKKMKSRKYQDENQEKNQDRIKKKKRKKRDFGVSKKINISEHQNIDSNPYAMLRVLQNSIGNSSTSTTCESHLQ